MGLILIPSKRLVKSLFFYASIAVSMTFLPILWLICYLTRGVAFLAASFDPEYGKMLSYSDACLDEDFVSGPPKSVIVTTIRLEGNVPSLAEFCRLFKRNVLEATLEMPESSGSTVLRYPEFKQYIAPLWGFRIWKNELDFRLEEHVREVCLEEEQEELSLDTSDIHQQLINKPFRKWRSPWEIVLYRTSRNDNQRGTPATGKCIVALRIHHSMADAKSILKCLVECLGQKKLKTAEPSKVQRTPLEQLQFCLVFPLNFVQFLGRLFWYGVKQHNHPWKTMLKGGQYDDPHDPTSDSVPLVVRLSPKIPLSSVKKVARIKSVLPSSVILSIIGGAIGKYDLRGQDIFLGITQPRQNHPPRLTNHAYMGSLVIPTTSGSSSSRLLECHRSLLEMKRAEWGKCLDVMIFLIGNLFAPWRRYLGVNYYLPVGITNIAGELEGFSIGKGKCTEFTMSAGPLLGVAGVGFCAFSYKDAIRVAVVGKETVLSEARAELIAQEIGKELRALLEEVNARK